MGYEVNYKFYERADKGYNTNEEQEFSSKVGDPFEEITLEQLAGSIMAQFARRDIMIFDCEVYELARKNISFKETKGGIILKNKKYHFDKGAKVHCEDMVVVQPNHPQHSHVPIATPITQSVKPGPPIPYDEEAAIAAQAIKPPVTTRQNLKLPGKVPIRHEIYSPEKYLADEAKARGVAFSQGYRYPIYEERRAGNSAGHGMTYVTVDDKGRKQVMHASHFVPESKGLIGDFDVDASYAEGNAGNMQSLR